MPRLLVTSDPERGHHPSAERWTDKIMRRFRTSSGDRHGVRVNISASFISKRRGPALTDSALVTGLTERQEWALKALIESYGPYVYGRAIQIVRDAELAQEIAQDALLVMWWKPERFDPDKGTLRSFLVGVARFKAIAAVRGEGGMRSRDPLLVERAQSFDCPSSDRGVAEGSDVHAALSGLSRVQRQALFLAYSRGLTYREVATLLEVPEGTVKTRIRDGLIQLRATLVAPRTA